MNKKTKKINQGIGQVVTNIPIDMNTINSLEDVDCIKCGEKKFNNVTKIKKMPKTLSHSGQEGFINLSMMECIKCGWLFNAKEWEEHNKKDMNEAEAKIDISETVAMKSSQKTDEKELCRKCGEFYFPNITHVCK